MGATSKRWKSAIRWAAGRVSFELSTRSLSMMSGLEPTIVIVPPRMAQKPIGMMSRDIG